MEFIDGDRFRFTTEHSNTVQEAKTEAGKIIQRRMGDVIEKDEGVWSVEDIRLEDRYHRPVRMREFKQRVAENAPILFCTLGHLTESERRILSDDCILVFRQDVLIGRVSSRWRSDDFFIRYDGVPPNFYEPIEDSPMSPATESESAKSAKEQS